MAYSARQSRWQHFLLIGVLLFSASGVLEATDHDHVSSEACRLCSSVDVAAATVCGAPGAAPRLVAAAAHPLPADADTGFLLLVATPLRGPPHTS